MKLAILGGGQLARMLSLSAHTLGISTICLDPSDQACARDVTEVITADLNDEAALERLVAQADYVTIEKENIPLSCATQVIKHKPFYPSLRALEVSQDRLLEKRFLNELGIKTAPYYEVNNLADLQQAYSVLGCSILKTRRLGYDGKGQYRIDCIEDLAKAWQSLQNQPLILEQLVAFDFEVSLIAVRSKDKQVKCYPLIKNQHQAGILRWSEPLLDNAKLQSEAEAIAAVILDALDYVGVLSLEFFYAGNRLLVNEMAPRVHNSGHWTIEGAYTSQFENHLRAIFDLPLGSTEIVGSSFMLNCIGQMPLIHQCLSIPGVHYHHYGKTAKPNRKLGHITLSDTQKERFINSKQRLMEM